MSTRAKVIVFAAVVVAFASGYMVSNLVSTPGVALMVRNEWRNAINVGSIVPVTGWNTGLESFYPGQSGQLRTSALRADKSVIPTGSNENGMFMDWGSAADQGGAEIIGGWEYGFGVAENLANTIITLDEFSPCPFISSYGIGLRDASGKVMIWMWAVPSNQACGAKISTMVNPGGGGPASAPTSFFTEAGFDLTQVTHLLFHERGLYDSANPANPKTGARVWNSWARLVLSTTVPVHESTWGSVKELFNE